MKLIYTKTSPYARKARVIALEKGVDLELHEEDLLNKSEVLLLSNPIAKVPVLILDNEEVLCDSKVICEYLDLLTDDSIFIPRDLFDRVKVLSQAAIADGLLDRVVAIRIHQLVYGEKAHRSFIAKQEESVAACLANLEQKVDQLTKSDYFSVAVVAAIGYIDFRYPQFLSLEKYAQLLAWYKNEIQKECFQKTMPE